jgi:hypothetical protein
MPKKQSLITKLITNYLPIFFIGYVILGFLLLFLLDPKQNNLSTGGLYQSEFYNLFYFSISLSTILLLINVLISLIILFLKTKRLTLKILTIVSFGITLSILLINFLLISSYSGFGFIAAILCTFPLMLYLINLTLITNYQKLDSKVRPD